MNSASEFHILMMILVLGKKVADVKSSVASHNCWLLRRWRCRCTHIYDMCWKKEKYLLLINAWGIKSLLCYWITVETFQIKCQATYSNSRSAVHVLKCIDANNLIKCCLIAIVRPVYFYHLVNTLFTIWVLLWSLSYD